MYEKSNDNTTKRRRGPPFYQQKMVNNLLHFVQKMIKILLYGHLWSSFFLCVYIYIICPQVVKVLKLAFINVNFIDSSCGLILLFLLSYDMIFSCYFSI